MTDAGESTMKFTEFLFGEVQTVSEWQAAHAGCLTEGETFERVSYVRTGAGQTWFWLECLCGAKYLCGGNGKGGDGFKSS